MFAVLIPIARTNEITNPSFEVGTTNWAAVGGLIARTTSWRIRRGRAVNHDERRERRRALHIAGNHGRRGAGVLVLVPGHGGAATDFRSRMVAPPPLRGS